MKTLHIEQLKYILEVSKEGSITKAASRLHLSPSALSQSISQLEKELGITIFIRSRKGTIPTIEGKKFINRGNEIITSIEKLFTEVSVKEEVKYLKIGCSPSLTYIVYDAFLLFHKENSNVSVEIIELDQDELIKEVVHGNIDLAFSPFSKEELATIGIQDSLEYQLLYTGYACVCVSKHSSLYFKDFVEVEDLKDEKMVTYNSKRSKEFNDIHLLPNTSLLFSTNNIAVLKEAILNGLALCLIYDFTFKNLTEVKSGDLRIIPLLNPGKILNHFWLMYSKNKDVSYEATEFKKKIMQVLNE